MQYIDAFNHFFPTAFFNKMLSIPGTEQAIGKRVRAIPCIYDLDERFRVMDMFKDKNYSQVLSISQPPLEESAPEPAMKCRSSRTTASPNCARSIPITFRATRPPSAMTIPTPRAKLERAFDNGANGVQIYSNVDGAPARRAGILRRLRGLRQARQADPAPSLPRAGK